MVTLKPLACRSLAKEAEMIPLPNEEVTPPVTKIYFVLLDMPVKENRITGFKDTAGCPCDSI